MKNVIYLAPAQTALRKHKADAARIMTKVDAYAAAPDAFPQVTTLSGRKGVKRIRVGRFRVLFQETATEIIVVRIGPRGEIYD